MRSEAKTVPEYLKSLPPERRKVISAVRTVMKQYLPKGYEEKMSWGAISYEVPLKTFPKTYNGKPLMFAALAAQKNNYAIYLLNAYGDPVIAARLKEAFKKAGKKLNMGKSCIRFKRLEDIPLTAIGETLAATPLKEYLERYEETRRK
jgi:hypothetical protein